MSMQRFFFPVFLNLFACSEDRPTPDNQKGTVTDQEQNRLSSGKAGEDWEATSLRNRWDSRERIEKPACVSIEREEDKDGSWRISK